ncbi:MAG: HU family DNA-binding protein [Clostridia bacterium]|jgi:nucleoid DNA-binding protein
MSEFKGLPGIDDYLSVQDNIFKIDISNIDHISEEIVAHTGVTKDQANRILYLFFTEIRSGVLKGDIVDIRGFFRFLISSPRITNIKKRVSIKFSLKTALKKRLNHGK